MHNLDQIMAGGLVATGGCTILYAIFYEIVSFLASHSLYIPPNLAGFLIFPLVLAFGWLGLSDAPRRFGLWRHFRSNSKLYDQPRKLAFSDSGLQVETGLLTSTSQWQLYQRVIETQDLFLLVYGKWLYLIVPKRGFPNAADLGAFRELVTEKIGVPNKWPSSR